MSETMAQYHMSVTRTSLTGKSQLKGQYILYTSTLIVLTAPDLSKNP